VAGKGIYISRVNWTIIVCKAPNITMFGPAVLSRFSVESMAKQSRVQPCHARVTSPPLVAAAFPTQGVAGTRGSKLPENLGLAGRPP